MKAREKLHSLFFGLLIWMFEDDNLAYLKTGWLRSRRIVQNQQIIQIFIWLSLISPFLAAGLVFWLMANVPYMINVVLAAWVFVLTCFICWRVAVHFEMASSS